MKWKVIWENFLAYLCWLLAVCFGPVQVAENCITSQKIIENNVGEQQMHWTQQGLAWSGNDVTVNLFELPGGISQWQLFCSVLCYVMLFHSVQFHHPINVCISLHTHYETNCQECKTHTHKNADYCSGDYTFTHPWTQDLQSEVSIYHQQWFYQHSMLLASCPNT